MAFARILFSDLVEKRLWPIALILVLAAIAVPVAISASGSAAPPPPLRPSPPPTQAPGLPAPGQALNAVAGPQIPHQQPYNSYERNPFRKPYGPRAATASTTPVTAKLASAAPTPATSTPVKSTPAPKSSVTLRTSGPVKRAPTPGAGSTGPSAGTLARFGPLDSYRVDLQLTDSTGQHTAADVRRLSALPSPADPLLLFLGVTKGGGRAAFLLTRPVSFGTGSPGRCLPSPQACEIVELASGQSVGFRLAGTPASSAPFLTFAPAITIKAHATPAVARAVRAQTSPEGPSLLAKADQAARTALHYTVADGALTELSPVSVKGL